MKNITGVLPAPQYENTKSSELKSIKRTNSLPVYSADLLKDKEKVGGIAKISSQ